MYVFLTSLKMSKYDDILFPIFELMCLVLAETFQIYGVFLFLK